MPCWCCSHKIGKIISEVCTANVTLLRIRCIITISWLMKHSCYVFCTANDLQLSDTSIRVPFYQHYL